MRPIGSIQASRSGEASRIEKDNTLQKSRTAGFANIKTEWGLQVAADRDLSETAMRIALAWPYWLNSKSLVAWPAQSTIGHAVISEPISVHPSSTEKPSLVTPTRTVLRGNPEG